MAKVKEWEVLDKRAADLTKQLEEQEASAAEFETGLQSNRAQWRRLSLALDVDGQGDPAEVEALQLQLLQAGLQRERRQYAASELRQRIAAVTAERDRLFLNQPAKFEQRTPALEAIPRGGSMVARALENISSGGWETVSKDRLFNDLRTYGTTAEHPLRDLLNGEILLCGAHEFRALPLDG